jgi:endonuclease III
MSALKKNDSAYLNSLLTLLKSHYPASKIALNYSNNFELLAAVMLSAQCTDVMVNKVTEKLFKKYRTVSDYAGADIKELEQDIKSTGFYHNKAKNLKAAAKLLIEKFNGNVPKSMEEMLEIPGVARKTANIVLGNAYGVVEGIAVDTHVRRLSQRLGLTLNDNPVKIEKDLMKLFDRSEWLSLTYRLIDHGRAVCDAKKPLCDACILSKICPSAFKFMQFNK